MTYESDKYDRKGFQLTQAAMEDRSGFDAVYRETGCTCFLGNPPCGWCTHPGNPRNQVEDDSCWEPDHLFDGDLEEDFTLDDSQIKACEAIEKWYDSLTSDAKGPQTFVLAGLAGTGKSTIISHVIHRLGLDQSDVAYCAYTGKAALVLKEKGLRASTIHRLIYTPVEVLDEQGYVTDDVKFVLKDEDDVPDVALIVVDEASMVSKQIQKDLESFNIPIIYVGDHGQLPPVGDSFADLMSKPDVRIEEIHRQAADNPIIKAALLARKGSIPMIATMGDNFRRLTNRSLNDDHLISVDQVLVGKNTTRRMLINRMRHKLGFTSDLPEVEDRVMCLRNTFSGLINGMQGYIRAVQPARDHNPNHLEIAFQDEQGNWYNSYEGSRRKGNYKPLEIKDASGNKFPALLIQIQPFLGGKVDFSKKEKAIPFDFAYAITTHKAQGSQYDSVLIVEEYLGDIEYHKRWLYTALTRGITKVLLFS